MEERQQRQDEEQKNLIDLHLHTTNSDGEEDPETVIEKAKETGHTWIAITDHNRFTFTEPQRRGGITVLPGNEFSATYYVPAWKRTAEIHIVGIFPNGVKEEEFEEIRSEIGKGKEAYVAAILENLKTRGIFITLDEVYAVERKTQYIGRHQIARILVDRGLEPDMEAAFDHQVGNFSPYYIPSTDYISFAPMDVIIKKIRECGGIPCLAHPFGYSMEETEIEQLIRDFKEAAGEVAAMEVYYEMYLDDPMKMDFLHKMQEKYQLLPSAASDRHRADQPFATNGGEKLLKAMMETLKKEQ